MRRESLFYSLIYIISSSWVSGRTGKEGGCILGSDTTYGYPVIYETLIEDFRRFLPSWRYSRIFFYKK